MKKVLVGMSGGIDSSVTVALLQQKGYAVSGITMRVLPQYEKNDPAVDALSVAKKLGIDLEIVDVSSAFENSVIQNFIEEYRMGNTPNPCICCNSNIKFGLLYNYAISNGYDFFATGHYAIIEDGCLYRGLDRQKDQSYFLYPVYNVDCSRILFPLGALTKKEVRNIAASLGLPNANKDESQDICFIQGTDYSEFLRQRCSSLFKPGPVKNVDGKVIGTHTGIYQFTIGQRKGLGALGSPMYVKDILPLENTVIAAGNQELFSNCLLLNNVVCGAGGVETGRSYQVQVRYRSAAVSGKIESYNGQSIKIVFDQPVRAIAPGQSAVLYNNKGAVVAGGIIQRSN
ncbi:MAG: tRNA 2-thiouridine(34) synthase MnmA [Fibrobacter sp.]|nr:tRNA 2-thiouridine(34) synthase MnmA [Fibrobacter sp.]